MIDVDFLSIKVDELIELYNKTYQNNLFRENNFKDSIINAVKKLIELKQFSKEFEAEIHRAFLDAVNKKIAVKVQSGIDEEYTNKMLEYYGDELGGYLLYCNQLVIQICIHEHDRYEQYKNLNN